MPFGGVWLSSDSEFQGENLGPGRLTINPLSLLKTHSDVEIPRSEGQPEPPISS